jgi:hypothetical protein
MLRLHRALEAGGEESPLSECRRLIGGGQHFDGHAPELRNDRDAKLLELTDGIPAGRRRGIPEDEKVWDSLLGHGYLLRNSAC